MKKVKNFIKKIKKKLKDLDKPLIFWNKLAIKILIFIHLLQDFIIVLLTYDNDKYTLISLIYLFVSNFIVFKCLERL